jgi:hypothetical protein
MEPDSGHRPDHRDHRWTPAAGHTDRLPLDRVVADASEHLVVMAALARAAGDILDAATIQLRDGSGTGLGSGNTPVNRTRLVPPVGQTLSSSVFRVHAPFEKMNSW